MGAGPALRDSVAGASSHRWGEEASPRLVVGPLSRQLPPAATEGAVPFPCLCPSQAEGADSEPREDGSFGELAAPPSAPSAEARGFNKGRRSVSSTVDSH